MVLVHPRLKAQEVTGMMCEAVLWVKIELSGHNTTQGPDPLFIGSVYMPGNNSKYKEEVESTWDDLNIDLVHLLDKSTNIVLMGDLNAHTRELCDRGEEAHFENQTNFDLGIDLIDSMGGASQERPQLPVRANSDTQPINANGKLLVEMCKSYKLNIINGRFGADLGKGECTSFNLSSANAHATGVGLIDYCVASDDLVPLIDDFFVDIFDPLLSDRHSPIALTLITPVSQHGSGDSSPALVHPHKRPRTPSELGDVPASPSPKFQGWTAEMASNFRDILDNSTASLRKHQSNTPPSQDSVDSEYSEICNEIMKAATAAKAFKLVKPSKKMGARRKINFKPWFDQDCVEKRKIHFQEKNKLRRKGLKSIANKASRDFQLFLSKKRRAYNVEVKAKLKSLKSQCPREN